MVCIMKLYRLALALAAACSIVSSDGFAQEAPTDRIPNLKGPAIIQADGLSELFKSDATETRSNRGILAGISDLQNASKCRDSRIMLDIRNGHVTAQIVSGESNSGWRAGDQELEATFGMEECFVRVLISR